LTMRPRFASAMAGGLKSIYTQMEVKLVGQNQDRLEIFMGVMDANIANQFVDKWSKDETGNFGNGLRAMGFSELIIRGDNYRRSIPRSEFSQWSQNYDQYLAQVRKAMKDFTGATKNEAKER
jgi:hypothetical protein